MFFIWMAPATKRFYLDLSILFAAMRQSVEMSVRPASPELLDALRLSMQAQPVVGDPTELRLYRGGVTQRGNIDHGREELRWDMELGQVEAVTLEGCLSEPLGLGQFTAFEVASSMQEVDASRSNRKFGVAVVRSPE